MKRRSASTATSMEEAMRDLRTLGPWLRRFLADYIVIERHLAANTQKSYRDSFKLLLPFVSTKGLSPNNHIIHPAASGRWYSSIRRGIRRVEC